MRRLLCAFLALLLLAFFARWRLQRMAARLLYPALGLALGFS